MLSAYQTTNYRVEHPQGHFFLRVGCRSRRLDALLDEFGQKTWAYLTAWNPYSRWVPLEQNIARQRALEAEVVRRGHPHFVGQGQGAGDWAPEASVLVLGITPEAALDLARTFRQAAILVGERGAAGRLLAAD